MRTNIRYVLFVCLIIISCNEHTQEDKVNSILIKNKAIIDYYCKYIGISSKLYASVIYGELYNNLDYYDNFDIIRGRLGYNSSIGFAQMKVSTLYWIEENYIMINKPKMDPIDKLVNDSSNIFYSCIYIKLIMDKYENKYKIKPSILQIASYYGKGIDNKNEMSSLYNNRIGKTAASYYASDMANKYFK
jgi:hypothetical protein